MHNSLLEKNPKISVTISLIFTFFSKYKIYFQHDTKISEEILNISDGRVCIKCFSYYCAHSKAYNFSFLCIIGIEEKQQSLLDTIKHLVQYFIKYLFTLSGPLVAIAAKMPE